MQHPTTLFFTGRMPFLPPNQQRQSTEGIGSGVTPEKKFKKLKTSALEVFKIITTLT